MKAMTLQASCIGVLRYVASTNGLSFNSSTLVLVEKEKDLLRIIASPGFNTMGANDVIVLKGSQLERDIKNIMSKLK